MFPLFSKVNVKFDKKKGGGVNNVKFEWAQDADVNDKLTHTWIESLKPNWSTRYILHGYSRMVVWYHMVRVPLYIGLVSSCSLWLHIININLFVSYLLVL